MLIWGGIGDEDEDNVYSVVLSGVGESLWQH